MLLKQWAQERTLEPSIDYEYFGVLDDRSVADHTLLLVTCTEYNGREPRTLRAAFDQASVVLMCLWVGKLSFEEFEEQAQKSEDGVLRT